MKHPTKKASEMSTKELASYIDYSVLKPEFTEEQIIELTKDGVELGCATICINPGYMDLCKPYVEGSDTKLCPVCDFPFGTSSTESKIAQAKILVDNYAEVTEDIKAVVDVCHEKNVPVKVIFETDALNEEQIRKACHCGIEAGVDFVKTSTGFLTGFEAHGATVEVIKIMQEEVQDKCQVKGSGCIRTREHFLQLIDMGIDRMGVGYKSVPVVLDLKR